MLPGPGERSAVRRFAAIVPWLILGATTLFIAQKPLLSRFRERAPAAEMQTLEVPTVPGIDLEPLTPAPAVR